MSVVRNMDIRYGLKALDIGRQLRGFRILLCNHAPPGLFSQFILMPCSTMTYDPIFELDTEEDEDDDVVAYEIIILNWLYELESLTPEELERELTRK